MKHGKRKPKPRQIRTPRTSRQIERQTLRLVVTTHIPRVSEPAPSKEPLCLPRLINVPTNPTSGSTFRNNFITYEFCGTAAVAIGQVRKQQFALWKSKCSSCRKKHMIRLPFAGGDIQQSRITDTCERCLETKTETYQGAEAFRVWTDNNEKSRWLWKAI